MNAINGISASIIVVFFFTPGRRFLELNKRERPLVFLLRGPFEGFPE
jgi:hypothetical protein